MAAALWRIGRPSSAKSGLKGWSCKRADPAIKDPRSLELEEAKEILAEIFSIDLAEA